MKIREILLKYQKENDLQYKELYTMFDIAKHKFEYILFKPESIKLVDALKICEKLNLSLYDLF